MKKTIGLGWMLVLACCLNGAEEVRPDLLGRVTSAGGAAVPKATIFIYTAGPRTGTASLCPSCYLDCKKQAATDADGKFKIEALDPTLLFRLLVVAKGHEAEFIAKVDPSTGPASITLKPLDEAALKSKTRIAGIVMDPEGKPAVGTVFSVQGVSRGATTRWGGTDADVDPVAVTDDDGRFLLACRDGLTSVHVIAEGRGFAKRWVTFTPGRDHVVRLQEGVMITGRLLRDGKPVIGAVVGVNTTERSAGTSLHDFETATDHNGEFALANVTPEREYNFFTRIQSMRGQGTLPRRTISADRTGTVLKLGDLTLIRGRRVAGQIVLSDGQALPPEIRIVLGRDQAWDYTEMMLQKDGRFEFLDVPEESVTLSVRVKDYTFSKNNPSLDWLNGSIIGRVDRDIDDLTLVMDPGKRRIFREEEESIPPGVDRQPRNKPLRGVRIE